MAMPAPAQKQVISALVVVLQARCPQHNPITISQGNRVNPTVVGAGVQRYLCPKARVESRGGSEMGINGATLELLVGQLQHKVGHLWRAGLSRRQGVDREELALGKATPACFRLNNLPATTSRILQLSGEGIHSECQFLDGLSQLAGRLKAALLGSCNKYAWILDRAEDTEVEAKGACGED